MMTPYSFIVTYLTAPHVSQEVMRIFYQFILEFITL